MIELTDRQKEIYTAYYDNNCGDTAAAKSLKISTTALRKNLYHIAKKGYSIKPDQYCEQAPAGWESFFSTIQSNATGEIVQRWDRVRPIKENSEAIFEYLKTRTPSAPLKITKPRRVDPMKQLEWTLADAHYGMLAWRQETGEDYDIKIARSLILDSASDIFARAGRVKETVLVLLGDNWHTDFYSGVTEESRKVLDVDTRFPKMVKTGIETFITGAEICLQNSERVKILVMYGNHDKQLSSVLPLILDIYFKNEPRVTVDTSPAKAHYNYWGDVATMYHHGDKTKKERLCSDFALHCAKSGHKAKWFFVKQGHLHRELVQDINGVIFEIVPSPIAREYYASAAAYSNQRATVATMYHKRYGQLDRYSITPQALKLKKERTT